MLYCQNIFEDTGYIFFGIILKYFEAKSNWETLFKGSPDCDQTMSPFVEPQLVSAHQFDDIYYQNGDEAQPVQTKTTNTNAATSASGARDVFKSRRVFIPSERSSKSATHLSGHLSNYAENQKVTVVQIELPQFHLHQLCVGGAYPRKSSRDNMRFRS